MALPPQTKGRVVPSNRGGLGEGAREGRAGVGEPRKLIHLAEPSHAIRPSHLQAVWTVGCPQALGSHLR